MNELGLLIISREYLSGTGGVATHVSYAAKALANIESPRVRVNILTVGDAPPKPARNLYVHRSAGSNAHFKVEGDALFQDAIEFAMRHWRIMRPEIIHVHDMESVFIGMMLKAAFDIPLVLTIHRTPKDWDQTLPHTEVKTCFEEALRKFRIIDRLVAPSKAFRERLIAQHFEDRMITVIYNGIPIRWLNSQPNKPDVFSRIGIDPYDRFILCPARLDPHKGIETLIDAIPKVLAQFPDVKFVVPGSGTAAYKQKLNALSQSLSVQNSVFLGPQNPLQPITLTEMPTLYRSALFCVLPSQRDGCPQAVLESFAFRKTIVGSRTGGIPELIETEKTGLTFHRGEPDDLAKKILHLLSDQSLCETYGRAAYKTVGEKFDADIMANNLLELYTKTIGEPRK